jgi:putative ABC transport system permease protein
MKCLGALSSFIRRLFLVESALIGAAGSILGVILGIIIPLLAYGFSFGFELVFGSMKWLSLLGYGFAGILVGTILAMLAAIYPANFAARMVPAMALRSNV